jgi:hypothetical protein
MNAEIKFQISKNNFYSVSSVFGFLILSKIRFDNYSMPANIFYRGLI